MNQTARLEPNRRMASVTAGTSSGILRTSLRASIGLLRWRKVIQQFEKFTPHLFSVLRSAVLERLERFVETESARPNKWLKDNSQWVELASSSEKPE